MGKIYTGLKKLHITAGNDGHATVNEKKITND